MNANMRDVAIRDIGCICCLEMGQTSQCEKHHLLTTGLHGNGKRRGEQFTIGLCSYHHRGAHAVGGEMARQMALSYGPSYADQPRQFREVFGDDENLLRAQNEFIEIWRESIIGAGA